MTTITYRELIEALVKNAAVRISSARSADLLSYYIQLLKHCESPNYIFVLSDGQVRIYFYGYGLQYIKSTDEEVNNLTLLSTLGFRSVAAQAPDFVLAMLCRKVIEENE